MATRTDPDGTRTEFGYDHLCARSASASPVPPVPGHGRLTWSYEYDLAGNPAAQTDYNGAVTRYAHDAAGQLTGVVNAAGQQVSYAYDLLGNLTERYADGAVTRFGYDPAGRLARAVSPDAELEFERDEMGRVTAEICNGRTVRSVLRRGRPADAAHHPVGCRDPVVLRSAGRPAALQADGQELRFGYDQAGRETARELPGGVHSSQAWDTAGRLTAQTLTADRPHATAARAADPAGRSRVAAAGGFCSVAATGTGPTAACRVSMTCCRGLVSSPWTRRAG